MTPEKIPSIQPNKQFPIGDVTMDTHRQKIVAEWFERVEDMDMEEYCNMVRFNHAPTHIEGERAYANFEAAVLLCKAWDAARGKVPAFAQVGYRLAMSFNHQTRLLPKSDFNFALELTQMRHEQQHLAPEFARFAWEGIASYPHVAECYDRLLRIGRIRFNLENEENREYFKAGMALPYILGSASRLKGYTPHFTGMQDKKFDPKENFSTYFTP